MARKKLSEMKTLPEPGRFVGTHQAAQLLGLSPTTVKTMVENGSLPAWKTSGGHRRIPAEALAAMARDHETIRRPVNRPLHLGTSGKIRVLIAEDDRNFQKVVARKLSTWDLPLEISTADDGMEALVAIGKATPDVLVADLSMPKIDGFQMIRTLRADPDLDHMDIVVITGLDAAEIDARGGLPRGIMLLKKPISFDQLHGFLWALELRRQMSASIA